MLTLLSCVFIAVGWVLLGGFGAASDWPKLLNPGDRFGYYLAVSGHSYRLGSSPQARRMIAFTFSWRRLILIPETSLNSDILALIVALYAIRISKHPETDMLTYGWKRAEILAAFFNGIFLVALSVSIIIHSIQRFIHLEGQ